MNEEVKRQTINQIAEQAVPDSLDIWPEIHSRVESAAGARFKAASGAAKGRIGSRRMLVGLAASFLLALIAGATFPLWSHPQEVSAEAILDRAQTAMDSSVGIKSYHLQMTSQDLGMGNRTISTEVWFGGSDLQRTFQQVKDPGGTTVSTSDEVFNGSQAWIANTDNGQTRVIHTIGTQWNISAHDPIRENSPVDVLAAHGIDKSRVNATLEGEATVAGRAVYQIAVTPKAGGSVPVPGPIAGVARMLVWVDKQSFLPLKVEARDQNGAVLGRIEVTSVEYNVAIPDSTFTYTPPAGATVFNFTGGTAADVKRALSGNPTSKPQPAMKP